MGKELKNLIEKYKKEIENLKEDERFKRSDKSIQTVAVLREVVNDLENIANGKRKDWGFWVCKMYALS